MAAKQTPFLDDPTAVKEVDAHQALASIEQLGSQVQQVWELAQELTFPKEYSDITKVVVAGMGGSILGTHVIQTLFKDQLNVPIIIAPDYTVPNFVDNQTLVIGSSYSGTTEETLAAVTDASEKGALLTGITSGGKLSQFLQSHQAPHLVFPTEFNPSQCARMGLGYSIFGQIALFARLGLIDFSEQDYQEVLEAIANVHLECSLGVSQEENKAKVLAFQLLNRLPVLLVAEHLEGAAHVFANQLNENAKTFAEYRVIPEMNHHLLEGFSHPESAKDSLYFFSVHSDHYHSQNQRRLDLTEELLEKHHLAYLHDDLKSPSPLQEVFALITLGAYTAFYLSMLYNQDPIPNPNVDWLKSNLK